MGKYLDERMVWRRLYRDNPFQGWRALTGTPTILAHSLRHSFGYSSISSAADASPDFTNQVIDVTATPLITGSYGWDDDRWLAITMNAAETEFIVTKEARLIWGAHTGCYLGMVWKVDSETSLSRISLELLNSNLGIDKLAGISYDVVNDDIDMITGGTLAAPTYTGVLSWEGTAVTLDATVYHSMGMWLNPDVPTYSGVQLDGHYISLPPTTGGVDYKGIATGTTQPQQLLLRLRMNLSAGAARRLDVGALEIWDPWEDNMIFQMLDNMS